MKKTFTIILLALAQSTFAQNIETYNYYLNNRVGIINNEVITENKEIVQNKKSYSEFNPFYSISINSHLINDKNIYDIYKLRALQNEMDTFNFNSKIRTFTNSYNQKIEYVKENTFYYNGNIISKSNNTIISDSSKISQGYKYSILIRPEDEKVNELFVVTINILPVITSFRHENDMIAQRFTGNDILYTLHLNPKIYHSNNKKEKK